MRGYPVNIRKQGKHFFVSFPDIPEAFTQGRNRAEALKAARDVLETAMDVYFEERRPVPAPSKPKRSQAIVELPPSVGAKVLLLNEMLRQNVRPIELARRIGVSRQEVNRLTDLKHATKIDRIDVALRALGKRLLLDAA
jgi:antitoxin HicB